jgi:hypothetical protein
MIFFCNDLTFAKTVDYFPHSLNAKWQYKLPLLKGGSMSTTKKIISSEIKHYKTSFVNFIMEEKSIMTSPGFSFTSTAVYVYALDLSKNEIYEFGNTLQNEVVGKKTIQHTPPWIPLKYPLKVGASWFVGVDDIDGTEMYRKVIKFETVKTKAGTFKNCAKIKQIVYVGGKKKNPLIYYYWYAPNVGLVKGPLEGELTSYGIPSSK